MKTIVIYLCVGVLLNIFGPLAKKISNEVNSTRKRNLADEILEREPIPEWKKIAFEFMIRLISLVGYPILYGVLIFDYFNKKHEIEQNSKIVNNNYLYYWKMGGAGKISCRECGHNQDIVSFLHGFGPNPWTKTGFQCQSCGKFHEIEWDINNSKNIKCECGGDLSKEEPIFCPKCKSKNMHYDMTYIT